MIDGVAKERAVGESGAVIVRSVEWQAVPRRRMQEKVALTIERVTRLLIEHGRRTFHSAAVREEELEAVDKLLPCPSSQHSPLDIALSLVVEALLLDLPLRLALVAVVAVAEHVTHAVPY